MSAKPYHLSIFSSIDPLRWGQSLLLGLVITLGLFWLMQFMILNNQAVFKESRDLSMVDFIHMQRETKPKVKERRLPDKPPPQKRPPPPRIEVSQPNPVQHKPDFDMPNLDMPLQTHRFQGPIVSGLKVGPDIIISADLIPLVRIAPRYPTRARMKRIEGWVKTEFTITEQGGVVNAVVVESHPHQVFDHEALRAITKWKFKPKIVGGQPIQQRAVQLLEFKLK